MRIEKAEFKANFEREYNKLVFVIVLALIAFTVTSIAINNGDETFRIVVSQYISAGLLAYGLWSLFQMKRTKSSISFDENGITITRKDENELIRWSNISSIETDTSDTNETELYVLKYKVDVGQMSDKEISANNYVVNLEELARLFVHYAKVNQIPFQENGPSQQTKGIEK